MRKNLLTIVLIGIFMKNASSEPMFQTNSPSVLSISGSAMQALKIACDEFVASGKDLHDFTITISQENGKTETYTNDLFVVTFMGKLTPGKRGLGTANRAPGSVTYFISKENGKIIKEQGIK